MGKCIEIEQADDGTYMVSECEPKMEAMGEGSEGEMGGQHYQSIDEALRAAGELLQADSGDDEAALADAQAGYSKGQGSTPRREMPGIKPQRPSVGAVFGG